MKFTEYCLSFVVITFLITSLTSCEADNMDAPDCHLTGKIVYKGQPIGVECESGSDNSVTTTMIELWQDGFGASSAQRVNVAQNGSFSTYVYAGKCRLITKKGVGPWLDGDTVSVNVKGNTNIEYEVTPYFTVSNEHYSLSADSILTVRFCVEKIVTDAIIKNAGVVINNTRFVDLTYNRTSIKNTPQPGELTYTIDLRSLKENIHLYARVFVIAEGADAAAYSVEPYMIW